MPNFLEYIEEDIKSKKTLFSTMPVNTKSNRRKFNAKIEEVHKTYTGYKAAVEKYLTVKSKSFKIADSRNTKPILNQIDELSEALLILNPLNTYFEKIGFDALFYEISSNETLNFSSLNKVINQFIDKFELINVKLTRNDFDYTFYVHEFMASFLEGRALKTNDISRLTEIFENIYWENPKIILHIELNFRKLIRKYEKKFKDYISREQTNTTRSTNLSYKAMKDKLSELHYQLKEEGKENIVDIIELAKEDDIDVNHFFEDSKIRTSTFSGLMLDSLNTENETVMNKFYESLERIKSNVEEYANYVKFSPLILDFKKQYLSSIDFDLNKENSLKKMKEIESEIIKDERSLNKINRKLFGKQNKFKTLKENEIKNLKFESIKMAKELSKKYQELTGEYFKVKVYSNLNNSFSIKDLFNLYFSFDYYKKVAMKNNFEVERNEELVELNNSFNEFAKNPTNVIVCPAHSYDEVSVARVIINKYRLLNINVVDEDLFPDNVSGFLEKVNLILRIKELEESKLDVNQLWFMVRVHKLIESKAKE